MSCRGKSKRETLSGKKKSIKKQRDSILVSRTINHLIHLSPSHMQIQKEDNPQKCPTNNLKARKIRIFCREACRAGTNTASKNNNLNRQATSMAAARIN